MFVTDRENPIEEYNGVYKQHSTRSERRFSVSRVSKIYSLIERVHRVHLLHPFVKLHLAQIN